MLEVLLDEPLDFITEKYHGESNELEQSKQIHSGQVKNHCVYMKNRAFNLRLKRVDKGSAAYGRCRTVVTRGGVELGVDVHCSVPRRRAKPV
jgi:hypothetical protein